MGEIADQIIDQIIDQMVFGPRRSSKRRRTNPQRGVGKGRWMSSQGALEISDMEDEHIVNAILMCRRHGNTGKERELLAEAKRRAIDFRVT